MDFSVYWGPRPNPSRITTVDRILACAHVIDPFSGRASLNSKIQIAGMG